MSHSKWLGQRTVRGLPATGVEKITTKKDVSIVEMLNAEANSTHKLQIHLREDVSKKIKP